MYLLYVMNHPRVLQQILSIISNRVLKYMLLIHANRVSMSFAEFHTEMNAGKFSFIGYNVWIYVAAVLRLPGL